jgi:hypothetical protein
MVSIAQSILPVAGCVPSALISVPSFRSLPVSVRFSYVRILDPLDQLLPYFFRQIKKIKIPAKTVVKFRVAKAAKDAVLGVKK